MSIKEELLKIAGEKNFSDSPRVLEAYSRDSSLSPPGMPNYMVKARDSETVSDVIKFANEHKLPVVPCSSKVHFYGATIPKQGGIILDLTGMNKILEIDELNRRVRIEAGVTWQQLTGELDKKGLRIMMPLLPHPKRSVVTDYLEREVITNTVYDYGEPMQSMEVVWPTGEIFRTGSASVSGYPNSPSKGANPSGPGLDFYRFVQGAQGTMGVITWANLKIERQPTIDKLLVAPVNDLDYAIEFLYRILRLRIGQECLLLNSINLASIIAGDAPGELESACASLPPWTLILVVSAFHMRPEEKIKYEMDALHETIKTDFREIVLSESLPGFSALDKKLLPMLRKPWQKEVYWKNRYKGACQSLSFITRPNLAPNFMNIVAAVAVGNGYPIHDIGVYVQPIEHNRACSIEFNFFYDSSSEAELVKSLHSEATRTLLNEGAIFTRPYGELASLVYERAAGYATALKRLKKVFDPNNVMNPGNLCF